jgi:hypothetical protein
MFILKIVKKPRFYLTWKERKKHSSHCLAYTRKIVLRTGGIAPRILILVNMQVGCPFHAPVNLPLGLASNSSDSRLSKRPTVTKGTVVKKNISSIAGNRTRILRSSPQFSYYTNLYGVIWNFSSWTRFKKTAFAFSFRYKSVWWTKLNSSDFWRRQTPSNNLHRNRLISFRDETRAKL